MIKSVNVTGVAPAVGPYCHAAVVGEVVYCSGNVGIDAGAKLVSEDVAVQAKQALANLATVLEQTGSGMDHVVKTTVFITNMSDYPVVNAVYAEAFGDHAPARSCVGVAELPLGAKVEVEAIALLRG